MKLTEEQIGFYRENGYLTGLPPVFTGDKLTELQQGYKRIAGLLQEDENPSDIMQWHRTSRWLYDVAVEPQLLDYVESLLGPNFYLWGSEFIVKAPHSPKIVPWHQDAYYWPLSPHNTVTVWIALWDVDEENGAMQVIPKSHKAGIIKHRLAGDDSVLSFELEQGRFSTEDAVTMSIPAGGCSLHDDAIVHGSSGNDSDRWRVGYILRYSATEVRCDLERNPAFLSYLVRGVDEFGHNPQGVIPVEPFGRPAFSKRIRQTSE
ncbi:phytanoyl-CoA dioxygenase family protein [Paenibacillus sp. CC-CFT747]|nr:phytanoyl-CoA dioxygenase family protein [Paenibacillus sp. CC-CFT747]